MSGGRIARWAAVAAGAALLLLGVGAGASYADGHQPPAPIRGAVLVLDTSGSMSKADLRSARRASSEFARAVPDDVRVGLITCAAKPKLVVKPTTDMFTLDDGLAGLKSGGKTSLYDAVRLGVSTLDDLGAAAERRLVVLSDGVDTASALSLAATAKLLAAEGVVADFVAYRYGLDDKRAMKKLANASGGRVLTADDATQLADAFAEIARAAPGPAKKDDERQGLLSWLPEMTWPIGLIIGTTFSAVLLLVLVIFGAGRRRADAGTSLLEQIAQYEPRQAGKSAQSQETPLARNAVGWTEQILRSRGWEEKLAERLDLAGVSLKPAEWTLLRVCASVVTVAMLILLGVNFFVGAPLGVVLAWAGTGLFTRIRISRRRAAFGEQLPDVLQLVAGSLQSGFSLAQALDAVVREDTQPAAGEISRALAETRIGVELEDALNRVAHRMASDDLTWIVMAVRIQREVGGNLAEVLLTTVSTMRERAQSRRQVRALSAEGRISAYILLALPFVIGGFFFVVRPEYMEPLYTTPVGLIMIAGAVVMMAVGSVWMRQLVKVEV